MKKRPITTASLLAYCLTIHILCHATPTTTSFEAFQLLCPASHEVTAGPWECGTTIDYASIPWSSTKPIVDTLFDPPAGHYYEIGVDTLTITATFSDGTSSSCQIAIEVHDADEIGQPICKTQTIEITLDENCERLVTPQMVLEGGPYGCPDNYLVQILGATGKALGNVAHIGLGKFTYTVMVRHLQTGNICWTDLKIRTDTLPPSITCPPDVTIACNLPADPAYTGSPLASGCFDVEALQIDWSDQVFTAECDSIFPYSKRTWTALDTFGNVTTCKQHIYLDRKSIDEVIFPPDFDGTAMPFLHCSDTAALEALADTSITGVPMLEGHPLKFYNSYCDWAVSYEDEIEDVCGAHVIIHRKWTVVDFCSLESKTHTQKIEVIDNQAPVFEVPDTIYISSLAPCSMELELPPISLQYECSPYSVEIWTPWDTLYSDGGVIEVPPQPDTVAIRYIVTDACDHPEVGITTLVIEPKLVHACPADTRLGWGTYKSEYKAAVDTGNYEVLAPLGMPELYQNCTASIELHASVSADTCGNGTMVRNFTITAGDITETCQQVVDLFHVSDIVVDFPSIHTVCGDDSLVIPEPIITGSDLDHVVVTFVDEKLLTTVADACYRVDRTYIIANTCVTGDSIDQEILEISEFYLGLPFPECDLDGDGDCDKHTFRDSWTATHRPGLAEANQPLGPDTDPDPNPWDGFISYVVRVYVEDTIPPTPTTNCQIPEFILDSFECEKTLTIPPPPFKDCSDVTVETEVFIGGTWMQGPGPYVDLPAGVFPLKYKLTDRCGNQTSCNSSLLIVDPPPVAKCKTQVPVQIPINQQHIMVWVSDFNDGSYDNCLSDLQVSFSPTPGDLGKSFTCCDVGLQEFQLYAIDANGQVDSCTASIILSSNCDCEAGVLGSIKMPNGKLVAQVEVAIESALYGNQLFTTDQNGFYYFPTMPGDTVIVRPFKDINPANGVTTLDAVLITKHILNVEPFTNPYQFLAADVNGSGSITTLDLVSMRKLVLQINPGFPVPSWRFVPAEFIFPDPENPWLTPIPDSVQVVVTTYQDYEADFIAIKIGDVNFSADPLNLHGHGLEERTLETPLVFHSSQSIQPDGLSRVDLFPSPGRLLGWQFALSYEPDEWEWLGLEAGSVAARPSLQWNQPERGLLLFSWLAEEARPVEFPTSEPAFSLIFRPLKAASAEAPIVQLHTEVLFPEAVFDGELSADVQIQQVPAPLPSDSFLALPPYPNPFTGNTHINLFMPEAGEVRLEVYSVEGQSLLSKHFGLQNGRHLLSIDADELPAAGAYLYALHTAWGTTRGWLLKL